MIDMLKKIARTKRFKDIVSFISFTVLLIYFLFLAARNIFKLILIFGLTIILPVQMRHSLHQQIEIYLILNIDTWQ